MIFWFPDAYKSYVYTILNVLSLHYIKCIKYAMALCLRNLHALIKKHFNDKKC